MTADLIEELSLVDWPDDAATPSIETLRPAGLPERAVLLIRSVSVIAAVDGVPTAVGDEVERSYRAAVRPRHGTVSTDAEAVVFVDESEAIAAYLVALSDGIAGRQWWWRMLPPCAAADAASAFLAADHPAAVVDVLVGWRRFPAVMEALDERGLVALVRRLADAHALDVRVERRGPAPTGAVVPAGEVQPDTVIVTRGTTVIASGPLLASALVHIVERVAVAVLGRGVVASPGRPAARLADCADASSGFDAEGPVAPPAVRPATPSPREGFGQSEATAEHTDSDTDPPPGVSRAERAPEVSPEVLRPDRPWPLDAAGSDPLAVPAETVDQAAPDGPRPLPERSWVHSRFAGVLYIVNPLRTERLPDEALCAAPWDVVEAAARMLVGEDDDPIWDVLAGFAGRGAGEAVDAALCDAVRPTVAAFAFAADLEPAAFAALFAVPGVVEFDSAYVDVHISMRDVHVVTRRLGLDVDPGWVPELGRVIRIHYRDDLP